METIIKRRKKQEPRVKIIRGTEKVIEHMSKSNLVNLKKKNRRKSEKDEKKEKKNKMMQRGIIVLENMMENNSTEKTPNSEPQPAHDNRDVIYTTENIAELKSGPS